MKFGVGQAVRRREDVRLVTGQGRYTDDMRLAGEAHAYFVRSPHPHAVIQSIDVEAARTLPGVIGVLTADDLGETGPMPVRGVMKNRDGSPIKQSPKALLPKDKARFPGEAIAMVVAESAAIAKDAADLVAIDYEPLAAAASLELRRQWRGHLGRRAGQSCVRLGRGQRSRLQRGLRVGGQNRVRRTGAEPRRAEPDGAARRHRRV